MKNIGPWIVQIKRFRGDWETLAAFYGPRKNALSGYAHLADPRHVSSTVKLRAVSETQATADYEAGRADNFRDRLNG